MMDERRNGWTAPEIGNLWNFYIANSLGVGMFKHFLLHCDDEEIRSCLNTANTMSFKILEDLTAAFREEGFPIPKAFGEEDVYAEAPRLFSDEFYLYYLDMMLNLGSLFYNVSLPAFTKLDLRAYVTDMCVSSLDLSNQVTRVLHEKGIYIYPPFIPEPEEVEFVKKQSFFNGYFGDKRPLLAMEIFHLFYNTQVNAIKTILCMGFSQVAKSEEVRDYFLRGKKINIKQHAALSQVFIKDELPGAFPSHFQVTDSVAAPYSDKLMLFHITNLSSAKLRNFGDSIAVSPRHDLAVLYSKFIIETGTFAEDGGNLLIKNGWMELPPGNIDRSKLVKTGKK